MQLGMIGLGRMGGNMVRRLMRHGHECVVYDLNPANVEALANEGAAGSQSMEAFVRSLNKPRAAWVMVPAGDATETTVMKLAGLMERGDTIIDGGNSYFKDDVRRARILREKGLHYVDVGTSGGVWGIERGYCMMIGGPSEAVSRLDPIFKALAPGIGTAPHTPGREGRGGTAEEGYLHCGSVVGSWLLDLTAMALVEDPELRRFTGTVQDSGEGRWTIMAAIEEAVPCDVLSASLFTRFRSRQDHTFAEKLLSGMRNKFGGHVERAAGG